MRLKVSSAKCRPFCLGLNVLNFVVSRPANVWALLGATTYAETVMPVCRFRILMGQGKKDVTPVR